MRIAYFTDTYLPQINGVTNTLNRLVNYLDRTGTETIVFAPEMEGKHSYETMVDTSFSLQFFLYPECRLSIPNLLRIRKVMDDFQPDLIHCVTPFNLGLSGLKYSKDHQIPIVASYHTNFDQYLDYYKLKFLENIMWDYFIWFHNQCLVNYAPSSDTIYKLEKIGLKNLQLWARGIDSKQYNPEKYSSELRHSWAAVDKTVLLYVGRLAPEKNLQLLFQNYYELNKIFPDKLHLVVTGEGPQLEEYKDRFKENITFTGYKKGEELAKIYASADIFAFPSTTETFGNVVLEAMASGLPVVGFSAGGVKDSIRHRENGLLCQTENRSSFIEALKELIVNKELRISSSQGALEFSASRSWESIFSGLIASYQQVVADKKRFTKSA